MIAFFITETIYLFFPLHKQNRQPPRAIHRYTEDSSGSVVVIAKIQAAGIGG